MVESLETTKETEVSGIDAQHEQHLKIFCSVVEDEMKKLNEKNNIIRYGTGVLRFFMVIFFLVLVGNPTNFSAFRLILAASATVSITSLFADLFYIREEKRALGVEFPVADHLASLVAHPRLGPFSISLCFLFLTKPENALFFPALYAVQHETLFIGFSLKDNAYLKHKYEDVIVSYLVPLFMSVPGDYFKTLPYHQQLRMFTAFFLSTSAYFEILLLLSVLLSLVYPWTNFVSALLYSQIFFTRANLDPFIKAHLHRVWRRLGKVFKR